MGGKQQTFLETSLYFQWFKKWTIVYLCDVVASQPKN